MPLGRLNQELRAIINRRDGAGGCRAELRKDCATFGCDATRAAKMARADVYLARAKSSYLFSSLWAFVLIITCILRAARVL